MMKSTIWIRIGAFSGAIAVVAGAFGAHGLENTVTPRLLEVFKTASLYQMFHALALIATGIILRWAPRCGAIRVAAWSFAVGTILFSGSLYALALTGETKLGMITPIGGLAFIVGWVTLGLTRFESREGLET